jgi:hypothetical protein
MSPLLLLASAAPESENREASPIALVLILVLLVALVFLIRSMNKHLRKVPSSFSPTDDPADGTDRPGPTAPADRTDPTGPPAEPVRRDAP